MPGASAEFDVPVEMGDGIVLHPDVYRPGGDGPWPVIVARTPYDKSDPFVTMLLDPLLAVRHGLIAVIQDVRGRHASEGGSFVSFASEVQDGADTIGWAARIDGSTGRVGKWGPRYLGNVQWHAAAQRPPALGAIAPSITFRAADGLVTRGGARELGLCRSWSVYAGFDAAMGGTPTMPMRQCAHSENSSLPPMVCPVVPTTRGRQEAARRWIRSSRGCSCRRSMSQPRMSHVTSRVSRCPCSTSAAGSTFSFRGRSTTSSAAAPRTA